MLPSNARNSNQGFTLAEITVILVVVGILVAIGLPSFLNWLRQKQLDDALVSLQGTLQEAQTQAIRRSTTCAVLIPDGDGQTLRRATDSAVGCLLSEREIQDGISVISNLPTNPKRISFSFRGNTTNSGTVVLHRSDDSIPYQRCLVISNGLGIMRTGMYEGPTNPVAADNCSTE